MLIAGAAIIAPPWGGKGRKMLEIIAVILVAFWLVGLVNAYTIGGWIHLLLVVAVVIILVRLIQGMRR